VRTPVCLPCRSRLSRARLQPGSQHRAEAQCRECPQLAQFVPQHRSNRAALKDRRPANSFETCVRHHCQLVANFDDAGMGGDQTAMVPRCPSCGRLMGLSRTIPASAGFRELQTFGCRDCGVWVTQGKDPWVGKRENLKRAPITCDRD
jgi:hypothetical protein